MLMPVSLYAQKSVWSYEIGGHYVDYTNKGDQPLNTHSDINTSGSPYIGINYRMQNDPLPLSIGLKVSMFKMEINHEYARLGGSSLSPYSFNYLLDFIHLQIPLAYHLIGNQSEWSAGVTTSLYFNIQREFKDNDPYFLTPYSASSIGTSNEVFNSTIANIDLSLAYSYFFKDWGAYQLGIKAYISYPMLNAITTLNQLEYTQSNDVGSIESFAVSFKNTYAPMTFGLGFILK